MFGSPSNIQNTCIKANIYRNWNNVVNWVQFRVKASNNWIVKNMCMLWSMKHVHYIFTCNLRLQVFVFKLEIGDVGLDKVGEVVQFLIFPWKIWSQQTIQYIAVLIGYTSIFRTDLLFQLRIQLPLQWVQYEFLHHLIANW